MRGAMLQYLVREPVMVPGSHYELLRGVRALTEGIEVISLMPNGCGYIDGPHEMVPLELGRVISALDEAGFLRTFPHRHGTDGMFAARMRKVGAGVA